MPVLEHFPILEIAREARIIARGSLIIARGSFMIARRQLIIVREPFMIGGGADEIGFKQLRLSFFRCVLASL